MPRSYVRILVHSVFGTKNRSMMIDPIAERAIHSKIREIAGEMKVPILRMNGGFDHIHIVHGMPRAHSIAAVMKAFKGKSCDHVRSLGGKHTAFEWQEGYGSFSCDHRDLNKLLRYVDNQKLHHYGHDHGEIVKMTFPEEYDLLLKRYGAIE